MDFELAETIAQRALALGREGADLRAAATEIVAMSTEPLPDVERERIVDLMEPSVAEMTAILTSLFQNNPPPVEVNGLWFGLVEMSTDSSDEDDGPTDPEDPSDEDADRPSMSSEFTNPPSVMIPYLAGSPAFDGDLESEWMCTLAWNPPEAALPLRLIEALNYERQDDESTDDDPSDRAWFVDTCLVEPLMMLCIYAALRRLDPKDILRDQPHIGLAAGFDAGDVRPLGIITVAGLDVSSVPPPKPLGAFEDTEDVEDEQDDENASA